VLRKPSGVGHPEHQQSRAELVRTVKLMSEVKVVRRWPRGRQPEGVPEPTLCQEIQFKTALSRPKIVAIGSSTGGPPVLQTILATLPSDFPIPVLIVQHIAAGFTQGLVEWLAQSSSLPVHVPTHGQSILPGHVYVAPDGLHMAVTADGRVELMSGDAENGLRPSVACLFRSVTKVYGPSAVGVLLTGMGKDGAWELKLMQEQGAVTFAQDRETSVVHGMPGEAIRLGGATYVLPPDKIRSALTILVAKTVDNEERAMTNGRNAASRINGILSGHDLSGS
jgi:two-component system chemotaxis response regulator CheB